MDEYSGAAAAYSLRLLNSNYTGDAIIVRRDSDNATANIGFVGGELNTTYLNEFCSGANGFVTKWFDQSGNSYDATNTTASQQPKVYDATNGIVLENSKPALEWSGSAKGLQTDFGQTYSQPNTFFVVHRKNNSAGHIFDGIDAFSRNAQFSDAIYSGIVLNGAYPVAQIGNHNLLTAVFNLTNSESYLNSQFKITGDAGSNDITGLMIGARYNAAFNTLDGTIQELIIYPTNQSSNRAGIENNVNNFYNIY